MKKYCTQNHGKCETCSLVNYGRDCHNNPVAVVKDGYCQCDQPITHCEKHWPNHYGSNDARLADLKKWAEERKMMKHTPGQLHIGQGNGEGSIFADNAGRMRLEKGGTALYPICKVFDFEGEGKANVARIVQTWNAHDELVAMLKLASKYVAKMVADDVKTAMPPIIALNRIEAAIKRAEGKEV